MDHDRQLLIFCPSARGGIADYAHVQADAIAKRGVTVTMLCPTDFCHTACAYAQDRRLSANPEKQGPRWLSRVRFVQRILCDARILDQTLSGGITKRVLFATYAEYLAPFWAWRFRRHQRRGVVFGAVAHDPVRDYQVGPRWWHLWSIAEAYSFLREVFVHEAIELDTKMNYPLMRTSVIPHGLYPFPTVTIDRDTIREQLSIPNSAHLFLSFGHVRDNKNLPLVIEALVKFESAWLLVAGPEAKPGQLSSSSLRELADKLGVGNRCRWLIGFLDAAEVSNCFNACDFVLLTYASTFRSASGAQNVAGWFRKPLLVSGGDGNLLATVARYSLGIIVSPDCADAICSGMEELISETLVPDWEAYLNMNNWERNGEIVVECLFE